jgi:hypothetical protein
LQSLSTCTLVLCSITSLEYCIQPATSRMYIIGLLTRTSSSTGKWRCWWVRNGFAICGQLLHYRDFMLRELCYDQDHMVIVAILNRFSLLGYFSGAFLHSMYEGPQLSRTHPTTPLCSPNEHEGCSLTPTATMPSPPHTHTLQMSARGVRRPATPPNMPLCSPNEHEGCLSTPCTPPHPSAIPTSRE